MTQWAIGLFEGEGCITASNRTAIRMFLVMNDEDVVRRFHRDVGVGKVRRRHDGTWEWGAYRIQDVFNLLWEMLPSLGQRRQRRAYELLCHRATNPPRKYLLGKGRI